MDTDGKTGTSEAVSALTMLRAGRPFALMERPRARGLTCVQASDLHSKSVFIRGRLPFEV
jgi:hypothetical protein